MARLEKAGIKMSEGLITSCGVDEGGDRRSSICFYFLSEIEFKVIQQLGLRIGQKVLEV